MSSAAGPHAEVPIGSVWSRARYGRISGDRLGYLTETPAIADTEREWVMKIIKRQGNAYETATLAID